MIIINKNLKVVFSVLLIFCIFFTNALTVFAVQSTTDGKYDGRLITLEYYKNNRDLFSAYEEQPIIATQIYHRIANMLVCDVNKDIQLKSWTDKGKPLEDFEKNWSDFHNSLSSCRDCSYQANYSYSFLELARKGSVYRTNVNVIFTEKPLVFKGGKLILNGSTTHRYLRYEYHHYLSANTYNLGPYSGDVVQEYFDNNNFSKKQYLPVMLSNPTGGYPPVHDENGTVIPGTGEDSDHGGGGRPMKIYDITVSPDLASKSFNQGEIDKIDITITNNSTKNGLFAVNFSKYSANNTSPRTVMDESAIFNYREKLWKYDVDGEGRYMYTPAIPLSAKSSKTISIPISYLDLSKLPKDDNGWIYLNFMECQGELKEGLISTQFKANKEFYFKLNFKPEISLPEYGDGTNDNDYPTYDKDGNVVDPKDDPMFEGDFANWFGKIAKGIVDIIAGIVDGIKSLGNSTTEFFGFLANSFTFLPTEIWTLLIIGISIVIILRIFGR